MKEQTSKPCKNPNCDKNAYSILIPYCCQKCKDIVKLKIPNLKLKSLYKPIAKVSKKKQIENLQYSVLRTDFLGKRENKICPITGKVTTDIHHKKGRVGNLLLDTKYWIALSREGHKKVEENPEWAKEKGYSLNRLSND
jgi:hypothetical protein